jgi:uncharacterized protein
VSLGALNKRAQSPQQWRRGRAGFGASLFGSLSASSSLPYSGGVSTLPETKRTTLKRLPKRGSHERETINQILDEGFICHVGFVIDGQPFVIPTGYARMDDKLILHGSQASRMLCALKSGIDVCVNVTLIDGLVLARSAFHHSMNYRSVVIFGRATLIEDEEEKIAALFALSEQIIPGRWEEAREPNQSELQQTTVLSLPVDEASAKIRTGPPLDDEEDYAMDIWAGVLPLRVTTGIAIADPRLPVDKSVPDYITQYTRRRN